MQWTQFQHYIQRFSVSEQKQIEKAFLLGAKAHAGQKRRSGEAYFMHPVAVALVLVGLGADMQTIIAALLHDTVEDTEITLPEIERQFGAQAAGLIDGVTKLSHEDIGEKPTLNEQIETLRKMFSVMEKDVRIMIIKLADRLHNMQTIEFHSKEKQRLVARETLDVYVKIADRLSMSDMRDELESLSLRVLDPDGYDVLEKLRMKNEKHGGTIMREMKEALKKKQPTLMRHVDMEYEHKKWNQLERQLENKGSTVTGITASVIVFVCKDIDECYQTLGALHQLWQRETLSFEDFINAPMINGYRGIHTTVILQDGTRVRCRIRTEEMNVYARKGICTVCFGTTHENVSDYLPWAQRISPLTSDTQNRSQEFWENLQSDILGEYMTIHGSGDQTVSIPKEGTALDGAFYLFHEKALFIRSIRVNGKDIDLFRQLKHGDSLQTEWSREKTIDREWLNWVKTGFATAIIRTALSGDSKERKIENGKKLLQEELSRQKAGYIEEFNADMLRSGFHELGYDSLEEAYIAIADGHLDPAAAFRTVFRFKRKTVDEQTVCIIRFQINTEDIESITSILEIYKQYGIQLKDMQLRPLAMMNGLIQIRFPFSPEEQHNIVVALRSAGATDVRLTRAGSQLRFVVLVVLLISLWGFDPVIAHSLLQTFSISTIDLTIVRFWSFAIISTAWLLWRRARGEIAKTPLPLSNPTLWMSVLLLIGVSMTTYQALVGTQPVHYSIPMTAAGLLLTSIVNPSRKILLFFTWLLIILGTAILVFFVHDWSVRSMVFTFGAVACYSLFSVVSERYKRKENIGARSAQYFFLLSVLCALLTLPLLPFASLFSLQPTTILWMSLYAIIFTGLPYYIYYNLLSHRALDSLLRFSFIIIYFAFAGQLLFHEQSTYLPWTLLSAAIVTIGALLPFVRARK